MNKFEINYRNVEQKPQINQLSTTFYFTIEEVFETLEIADVNTPTDHSMMTLL